MDFNIIIYKDKVRDSDEQISAKVKRAFNLGYEIIALSVYIEKNQIDNIPEPPKININNYKDKRILTRLTVQIEDTLDTHRINKSPIVKKYDILSIEPLNEKILMYLTGGHFEFDIFYLSNIEKMPTYVKKANFSLLISKGIAFEISYGEALFNQTIRQFVISSGQILTEKTKGKNILLSNGTQLVFSLRSPIDVSNLGLLFGLKESNAKRAVFKNGLNVIKHSEIRKNVNISAITISKELDETDKHLLTELKMI